jgi:signal transduction histidine kinase
LSVIRNHPGTSARIVVADAGTGIPADQLPLIFDRFRTSDGGQSRGTGLGLPLVRAVAYAHGGDVTVRSTYGKGSEFELTLPVPVRSALPAAPAGLAAADLRVADLRVADPVATTRPEDQGSSRR